MLFRVSKKWSSRIIVPLIIMSGSLLSTMNGQGFDSLMPVPQTIEKSEGRYRLDKEFQLGVAGNADDRLYSGATRFLRRLDNRTGLFFGQNFITADSSTEGAGLFIRVNRPGEVDLGEDESYQLTIEGSGIKLLAETDLGALHGLESLLQLLSSDADGYYFPNGTLVDAPRFAWRGLMIDSARHFMPVDMIKRNLDGMAAVKLNVMHWHLTEDQGFRVESKTHPRLHEYGSDGLYYTHEQVKEIIAYAAERGIRVYPEFDVPGHATSWLVGHPELGSAPGPYEIERQWGIFNPTLDPTNEDLYVLLDDFFGEMAELFPDDYLHIGGDEVHDKHWQENESIQGFMKDNGIADSHALQSYFNQRILKILTKYNKKMIGWDEILQPDMPKNIMIHSWRGRDSMVAAAKDGYRSLLSNGYYIDLMQPASFHYENDPLPADIELSYEEKKLVLGGEATMWSEHVTDETVDSRIWPRTAAIAERLWSSGDVTDVDDMYRRLDIISLQLEEHGLTHIRNREVMMRRLTKGANFEALRVLADVVEPLKIYKRNSDNSYRSYSPYSLLADIAIADAPDAMKFKHIVEAYLLDGNAEDLAAIHSWLEGWKSNHSLFLHLSENSPVLREADAISLALSTLAKDTLKILEGKEPQTPFSETIKIARQPVAKVELQVVDAIEALVEYTRSKNN